MLSSTQILQRQFGSPRPGTPGRGVGGEGQRGAPTHPWFAVFCTYPGADQSRPAPVVAWIAMGILAADCGAFAWLAWLHYSQPKSSAETHRTWRFSIRHLLIATTTMAVLMVVGRWSSRDIAFNLLHGLVFCFSVWLAIRFPSMRWPIVTILVCLSAPFLWTLRQGSIVHFGPHLYALNFVFPAFIESLFVSSWLGQHFERFVWFSMMISTIKLAIGVWLSFLGPKAALAYTLVLLTLSLFGSFVLHALMRA